MKRTFWTRNVFIGVLMGLVMVLGVQGTADALTFTTSRSGDLQTVREDREFTIRFSVSLRGASLRTGYKRTPTQQTDGTAVTITDANRYYEEDGTPGFQGVESTVTYTVAYDYDQESISIAVPSGVTLQKINGRDPVGSTPFLMYESTHDDYADASDSQKLSGSVTLTFLAGDPGAINITITGNTDVGGAAPTANTTTTFTVYIVAASLTVDADTLTGLTNGTSADDTDDPRIDPSVATSPPLTLSGGSVNANVPITYRVTGPGRVYVGIGERKTSATQTLHTSSAAPVFLDMNGGTNRVAVETPSVALAAPNIYIYGRPTMTITNGANQQGVVSGRLNEYLAVQIKDAKNRPIPGLAIDFASTATGAMFTPLVGFLYGPNRLPAKSTTAPQATGLDVYTDRNGEVKVYCQLGSETTEADQVITATLTSRFIVSKMFNPTLGTATKRPTLDKLSGDNQRTDQHGDVDEPLVVIVRRDGNRLPGHNVLFVAGKGTLRSGTSGGKRVTVSTDNNGEAQVTYEQEVGSGGDTVIASITSDGVTPAPAVAYERSVTFNVNGGSGTRPPTTREPAPPAAATNRIGISLSSSTGEPGDEITITVRSDPSSRTARLTSDDFADSLFSPQSGTTPFESTLTLPDEDGEYTITAEGFPLDSATATVTVETGILGRITVSAIGQPSNGAQNFSIRVVDTDGDRISGALTVRLSGSGFTTRNVETLNGIGDARLTLPTAANTYTLTASAEDYTPGTTRVRIAASEQRQETEEDEEEEEVEEEEEEETPEPASIEISGPATRSGTANTALEAALLVRVLDADNAAVEDARVTFRVKKGRGELSQRGSRRGIVIYTDSRGYARAPYTPITASSTVEANVPGVREIVTFTITATGAAAPTDTPGDPTPGTTRDTTSDTISPTVLVAAAQRPPMLWVASGKIYTLVAADVQAFVPSASNVMNIAIGGGKVYWTEKTSASSGTINSANLDGSDAKELTSILAIPRGIAVDVPNSQLYWTNSRGRIQSANLDGSGIQNVMQNIRNPNDLALAGGNVYWTESNHGSVRFVNLKGQKQVRVISTGDDPAGSLAIGGGKVYWTEKVGDSGGTINSANLNGSGAMELASIQAAPIGIAVDTARSKLFWTNARGRVQTASLSGSSIRNVVNGLESPGEILLSNSIKAPAMTPAKSTTTTAGKNKYDINADGAVDDKDVDAIIVAVAAKITAAKYDVNGDGTVDFNDVVAVSANKESTASAPTLLGRKFSALEVDRLQEQIDLLIASGDRSPAAMKTLIYLQQLIAMARPEKTQLLANYPNPFNPETWIPYELATDTDVKITIYTSTGVVVQALQLGHQSAGYYTDRDRAAYWDGRNAFGEPVASGVYYYQLETDHQSLLRKMVILK